MRIPSKVLLVDDHKMVRDGIRLLLEKQTDIVVVGEAGNGEEAVLQVERLRPDIVLMDISMPILNGIDASRRILRIYPETGIIGLSMHSDSWLVREMLHAGVSGFLLKENASTEVIEAIHALQQGRRYLSQEVARIVVRNYMPQGASLPASSYSLLSPRERQVLQLIAEGDTTKEIADKLSLSSKTVEVHRSKIAQKLGVHSIAQLTKYAIQQRLTSVGHPDLCQTDSTSPRAV